MEINAPTLLKRAVAGDDDALVRLLDEVSPSLHSQLQHDIGRRFQGMLEADDVLQVTCLEAFLRIRSFEGTEIGTFYNWLRRIAMNNLRDAVRELERDKRPPPGRRTDAPPDESYAALVDRIAATTTTPSRICRREELRECVDQALRQLPPNYERVLRLYELEGLSGPEVAERMGRRHGAIRVLIARARERLAGILASSPVFASRV